MTKEERELLLKDLSARLPYDCKVTIANGVIDGLQWDDVTLNSYLLYQIEEEDGWEYVKPYLRPMTSMTAEEKEELWGLLKKLGMTADVKRLDWLVAHHFDIRNLIEKGLAIEAPEGMYNN